MLSYPISMNGLTMTNTFIPSTIGAMLFACFSHSLSQGASYSIEFSGPTTVPTNTHFSTSVLTETLSEGATTVLGDVAFGLISGNFQVQILTGNSALTTVTGNNTFDSVSETVTADPWVLTQADLDIVDGTPAGELVSPGKYRLLLGTISGLSAAYSDSLQSMIIDPAPDDGVDDMVLGDWQALDGTVFHQPTFSMTIADAPPITEPTL